MLPPFFYKVNKIEFPQRSFFTYKLQHLPGLESQKAEIDETRKEELDELDDIAALSAVEGFVIPSE